MSGDIRDQSFLKSVKGKVVFGFLVGLVALVTSYFISKGAFDEVEEMVSELSTPNEKLRLVNSVFQDILLLNQLQNGLPDTIKKERSRQEMRDSYALHSNRLKARLDTLAEWFSDSQGQLVRLDSIRYMLDRRSEVFDAYVRERRGLVTNSDLKKKVDSISEIIATSAEAKGDSTVITTEKQTTTTTTTTIAKSELHSTNSGEATKNDEGQKKGFLNKLFKGKKAKTDEEDLERNRPVVIKKEEVKVSIDTLTIAKSDSTIQVVGQEVKTMAANQMVRANRFLERERQLQMGEALLIGKLMEVMREVETDVLNDMYRDNGQVKQTIGKSINNIGFILLGALSLTALLGFLIFADITRSNEYRKELILAKEEADYHSEAKQRFLANMSHEIRTPLQSIIGFSELVKNQEKPSRAQLEIIHKSSEHLLHLVNEILDYSRIISDSFEFVDESFEINQLLEEVTETLEPQARGKGLEFSLKSEFSQPSFVSGDAFRLKQILHNLIGNAIKFTKEGKVELVAEPVLINGNKEIRMEVRDTGIGMNPVQIRRIFNQFDQGHAGITPEYGGSGLGLSIVKALVAGQGGRIQVNSKPGEFSSFVINLPFREGQPFVKDEDYDDVTNADLVSGSKVWIVDDDPYILQWLKTVLEQADVTVKAFSSPVEADACLWDPELNAVFVDMRMPQMSGPELCEKLRKKADPSVRFIACTAMALPDERTRILRMGFDDVLMKPFKKSDVWRVLGRSQPAAGATKNMISAHAGGASAGETEGIYQGSVDISNLISMTMGDEQLLKDSLEQFIEDTVSDLQLVEMNLKTGGDRRDLRELFHKLAGRTGQVGALELGGRMRQIEILLAGDHELPFAEIGLVVRAGYELTGEIQEKYVS